LRRKVDDGHARKLIHTVRGVGYELRGETAVTA
jgi:DNA-binding response OmpR family regulator